MDPGGRKTPQLPDSTHIWKLGSAPNLQIQVLSGSWGLEKGQFHSRPFCGSWRGAGDQLQDEGSGSCLPQLSSTDWEPSARGGLGGTAGRTTEMALPDAHPDLETNKKPPVIKSNYNKPYHDTPFQIQTLKSACNREPACQADLVCSPQSRFILNLQTGA